MDARELRFPAGSFDLVALFETVYCLDPAARFFSEARRVLRAAGRLLIVSLNPEANGFSGRPGAVRYYSRAELGEALDAAGFAVEIQAGFPVAARRPGLLRRLARGWGLGGESREVVPARLATGVIQPEAMTRSGALWDPARYRVLYATARKT